MKIIIVSQGSQGDINPLLSLGRRLKSQDHNVIFCAPGGFNHQYIMYGFEYYPTGNDFNLPPEQVKGMKFLKLIKESIIDQFKILTAISKDAHLIIGNGLDYAGSSIAELYKIPYISVVHVPAAFRSKHLAPISVSNRNLPKSINSILWRFTDFFGMKFFGKDINSQRQSLLLPKFSDYSEFFMKNAILSANKTLAPMPPEYSNVFRTQYWVLEDEAQLDTELINFIDAGVPTIYIGFGSMIDQNSEKTTKILNELINIKEYRFVISKGWAHLNASSENKNVYFVEYVPHTKLFPKMSVIIHHGGAGTTHTSAKSGVPQILVIHAFDQNYWGDRIYKLKLGPKPLKRDKLTFDSLKNSIDEVLKNPVYKENAVEIAKEINSEDGVGEMVNYIERICENRKL